MPDEVKKNLFTPIYNMYEILTKDLYIQIFTMQPLNIFAQ